MNYCMPTLCLVPVALVVVSGDGLWVVVDHDGGAAETTKLFDTTHRTPVKLNRAADPVGGCNMCEEEEEKERRRKECRD